MEHHSVGSMTLKPLPLAKGTGDLDLCRRLRLLLLLGKERSVALGVVDLELEAGIANQPFLVTSGTQTTICARGSTATVATFAPRKGWIATEITTNRHRLVWWWVRIPHRPVKSWSGALGFPPVADTQTRRISSVGSPPSHCQRQPLRLAVDASSGIQHHQKKEKLGGEDPKSWAKIGINILDHKLCFKLHGVPTQPSIHHENNIYISEKIKCPFFAPLFESSLMHSDCKNKTVEIMFRDSKMQYRTPLEKTHPRYWYPGYIPYTAQFFAPAKKILTSNKEISICITSITSIPTSSSSSSSSSSWSSSSTTAAAAHTSLEPYHLANYLTISSSINNKTEPHKAVVETNPVDDAPKPALLWMISPTAGNPPTLLAKMRFSFAFTTSLDEDVTKSHPWHQMVSITVYI